MIKLIQGAFFSDIEIKKLIFYFTKKKKKTEKLFLNMKYRIKYNIQNNFKSTHVFD